MYREFAPPESLAPLVECFWRHEVSGAGPGPVGVVLPDGRVDVLWTDRGETLVAGPQTSALPRPLEAPFAVVGVRLHPGVGPALLGVPAHELANMHVPLEAIDSPRAAALAERMEALGASDALDRALAPLAERAPAVDPLVRAGVGLLARPDATIQGLAYELSLSERQLHRRFRDSVGYGPKALQRVLRFQRFLDELGRPRGRLDGLAGLAASSGYADQAHLTRESRELSGLSPGELKALWAAQ